MASFFGKRKKENHEDEGSGVRGQFAGIWVGSQKRRRPRNHEGTAARRSAKGDEKWAVLARLAKWGREEPSPRNRKLGVAGAGRFAV